MKPWAYASLRIALTRGAMTLQSAALVIGNPSLLAACPTSQARLYYGAIAGTSALGYVASQAVLCHLTILPCLAMRAYRDCGGHKERLKG